MFLEIITPEKKVFAEEVISAQFPGAKGSFQVLNNHAPLISSLEKGSIKIKTATLDKEIQVEGGIVEVLKNKITVLAEAIWN